MKTGGAAGEVVTLEGGLKYQGKLVGGVPNGQGKITSRGWKVSTRW
jgi:hypothetical protein